MPVYAAFDRFIDSEITLPAQPAETSTPDLFIRRGRATPLGPDAIGYREYIQTRDSITSVNVHAVGRFQIDAGREIVVDALPGVGDDAVRVYLLGLVIGIALMQSGVLTFHAGAVTRNGRAIAFMGSEGVGKSTLTAYFCSRGYHLLSEDLLALRQNGGNLAAYPGYPRLKLTDESAAELGVTGDEREPVFGKRVLRLEDKFHSAPAGLHRIYLLETGAPMLLEPCEPKTAARELVTHWFGTQFGAALIHGFGPGRLLAQAVAVARGVPVRRLQRPLDWATLPATLDLIEKDLATDDALADPVPYSLMVGRE